MKKIASYIGGLILVCIVIAISNEFKSAQSSARIDTQQAEQAKQETAVLQMMSNAAQFAAQQQAAEARAQAERNSRIQETAAGVAAGIHQADRQAVGLPPR